MVWAIVFALGIVLGFILGRRRGMKYVRDFNGYAIYEHDKLESPAAIALIGFGQHVGILVGPYFRLFSPEEQEAILYHEIGHIVLAHEGKGGVEDEFAADRYAIDQIGVEMVVAALERTRDVYSAYDSALGAVNQRLLAIRSHIETA